jgi:hopanoid biosynthesis associated protein HpnK
LHLVLVEGRPAAPPAAIPHLLNGNAEFPEHLVRAGIRFFFHPQVRRQLALEIRAQFDAFMRTGLALDHVNAHNHMHLHPTVLKLLLEIGKEYGMRAIRIPREPPVRSARAAGAPAAQRLIASAFLAPWMGRMRRECLSRGVRFNDYVFGMTDSGKMTARLVLAILEQLPEGTTELYFHPATRRCPELDRTMREYRHREELEALTSEAVAAAFTRAGVERISFSKL